MAEETKKKVQHEEKPLEKLTVKELREIAMEIPHSTAIHDMKKDEIIAFIKESRGIKDETTAKKKKKVIKLKMTKAELKAKIRELKGLKMQMQEEQDGKKVKVLRRLISRLKKKSRSVAGV